MKRSLVNESIKFAKELLEKNNFKLPDFGYWSLDQWKEHKDEIDVIKQLMLGWDMTDHGLGRFDEIGCVLFTIRNGLLDNPDVGVPYAEKLLIFKEGQRLPIHYHGFKTEDIINRGGGVMFIKLYNTVDGKAVDTPVDWAISLYVTLARSMRATSSRCARSCISRIVHKSSSSL